MELLFIVLPLLVVFLWIWAAIFNKAGFPRGMCLLMMIPVVNFVALVIFAFSEWPIEKELFEKRRDGETIKIDRVDTMLRQAAELE
ncbi:MAG: hypothetical protein K8R46_09960, partial [Pirellulales bacterium]|nr:hypothetical protein [Pirellulales bacterium]